MDFDRARTDQRRDRPGSHMLIASDTVDQVKTISAPAQSRTSGNVIDLMDALRKSLKGEQRRHPLRSSLRRARSASQVKRKCCCRSAGRAVQPPQPNA